MKITISFLHLEHTQALDERIREKSLKLAKYFNDKGTMKWNCYVKSGLHYAEVTYHAQSFEYHAKAHSDSLYKTIDIVLEKIEKQVIKKKEKFNKIHRDQDDLVVLDPESAWTDRDDVA